MLWRIDQHHPTPALIFNNHNYFYQCYQQKKDACLTKLMPLILPISV